MGFLARHTVRVIGQMHIVDAIPQASRRARTKVNRLCRTSARSVPGSLLHLTLALLRRRPSIMQPRVLRWVTDVTEVAPDEAPI